MNRGIALFIGLAALFAHTLAIYSDGSGALAPTCDRAYAAFRVARNLVHEGVLRWNPSEPGSPGYPSLTWTLWIAVAERLRLSPNAWAQWSGIAAALGTVALAARFHVDRIASLIGPMLLVVGGGLAAAAACGTETTFLALIVTGAFLAYERGASRWLGALLALACLTRADGLWLVGGLVGLRLAAGRRGAEEDVTLPSWRAFAPALVTVLVVVVARLATSRALLAPTTASLFAPAPGQWSEGLRYLRDFAVSAVSPLAIVFPLAYFRRGRLSQSGRDALILSAVWVLGVLLTGGDTQPFYEALVPALPLIFHAVQEGLTCAIDSGRALVQRAAVIVFVGALLLSGLASTFPVDRGPLPTEAWQRAWLEPTTRARPGFEEPLGRLGLFEEIRMTERLRGAGIFLRDSLDPGVSVLTPWPGAIGYLSRLTVLDLAGRATPSPGAPRCTSWRYPGRTDTLAWLATEPDYVVPSLYLVDRPPTRAAIAAAWVEEFDAAPGSTGSTGPDRAARIEAALEAYEVVTIPLPLAVPGTAEERTWPFYVLRRRELALRPTIAVAVRGDTVRVEAHNRSGHRQMANLRVRLEHPDGRELSLRPTGRFTDAASTFARTNLLIYPTGGRSIALARFEIPELPRSPQLDWTRPARLRAVLVNPGSRDEREFWNVSEEVVVEL